MLFSGYRTFICFYKNNKYFSTVTRINSLVNLFGVMDELSSNKYDLIKIDNSPSLLISKVLCVNQKTKKSIDLTKRLKNVHEYNETVLFGDIIDKKYLNSNHKIQVFYYNALMPFIEEFEVNMLCDKKINNFYLSLSCV